MMKARQFKHEGFVESGKDGRFRVKEHEVTQQPYSQIGAILYKHPLTGKLKLGTGFAITPDCILTVAHNIYVP
jgi:V8-like Glu-specific endopeptidase